MHAEKTEIAPSLIISVHVFLSHKSGEAGRKLYLWLLGIYGTLQTAREKVSQLTPHVPSPLSPKYLISSALENQRIHTVTYELYHSNAVGQIQIQSIKKGLSVPALSDRANYSDAASVMVPFQDMNL